MLRDHGQARKYYHEIEGYNGRLDAIQCGILHVKLSHLSKWNARRRELAAAYNQLLAGATQAIGLPFESSWSRAVYHLYVVRTDDREGMLKHLANAGVGAGIHYPVPLHAQNAYRSLKYAQGDFPVAEKAARQVVSLPMYPQLTAEQQGRVAEEVLRFAGVRAPARRAVAESV